MTRLGTRDLLTLADFLAVFFWMFSLFLFKVGEVMRNLSKVFICVRGEKRRMNGSSKEGCCFLATSFYYLITLTQTQSILAYHGGCWWKWIRDLLVSSRRHWCLAFEKVKQVERTGIHLVLQLVCFFWHFHTSSMISIRLNNFWTNFVTFAGQPQAWIIVRLDPVPPVPGLPPQEWPQMFSANVGCWHEEKILCSLLM